MKKQYFGITLAVLIMACGNSNAEKTGESEDKKTIQTEKEVSDQVLEEVSTEKVAGEVEVLAETEVLETMEVKELEVPTEEIIEETSAAIEVVAEEELVTEEEVVEIEEIIEIATVKPNHSSWDALTKKYITAGGKVNYKGMKTNLSKIRTYLDHLANTAPKSDWNKNEKLAYWINLYNASTVHLIASNYPVTSITKINGGKPWDKKFVKSGDKVYTLNQIENEIVRPQFKDPRIHAALNCAAVSCPKILNGAFLPKTLNAQLDKRTKSWINSTSDNKLSANKAEVSKIFEWYAADFKAAGGTIGFINKYATTKVSSSATVSFLEYNWNLNE